MDRENSRRRFLRTGAGAAIGLVAAAALRSDSAEAQVANCQGGANVFVGRDKNHIDRSARNTTVTILRDGATAETKPLNAGEATYTWNGPSNARVNGRDGISFELYTSTNPAQRDRGFASCGNRADMSLGELHLSAPTTAVTLTETPRPVAPQNTSTPTPNYEATSVAGKLGTLEAQTAASATAVKATQEANEKNAIIAIQATGTAGAHSLATATAAQSTMQALSTGTAVSAANIEGTRVAGATATEVQKIQDEATLARRQLEAKNMDETVLKTLGVGAVVAAVAAGAYWYSQRRHNNAVARETSRIETMGRGDGELESRGDFLLEEVRLARLNKRSFRSWTNNELATFANVGSTLSTAPQLAKAPIGQELVNVRAEREILTSNPVMEKLLAEIDEHREALAQDYILAKNVITRMQAAETAVEAAVGAGIAERVAAFDAAKAVQTALRHLNTNEPGHPLYKFEQSLFDAKRVKGRVRAHNFPWPRGWRYTY